MNAVIELDREEPPPRAGRRRPGIAAAAWLAVLLVIALSGPSGASSDLTQAWRGSAPLGFFWLTGDALYALDSDSADPGLLLVRRSLSNGRTIWRYPLDGTLATLYQRDEITVTSQFPPTPSLPTAALVIDSATASTMGSYPVAAMPLVYFSGATALVIDRVGAAPPPTPPGTNQFRPSPFFFDGATEAHRVTAIDLATGTPRWSRDLAPGTTWALPEVYPWNDGFDGSDAGWFAVIRPDRELRLLDVASGTRLRRTTIGVPNEWSYVVALHDTVVVTEQAWPQTILRGYKATDLSQAWRFEVSGVPEATAWPVSCSGVLCMASTFGVWAFTLDNGRGLWHYRIADVFEDSQQLLAVATVDGQLQIDVATGTQRPLPAPWRVVQTNPHGEMLVVARSDDDSSRLGILSQRTGELVQLGTIGRLPVGRCQAADAYVACAEGPRLRVWRIPG